MMDSLPFSKRYTVVILALLFILIFLLLVLFGLKGSNSNQSSHSPAESTGTITQQPFKVVSTYPKDDDIGVPLGEFTLVFSTDRPIESSNSAKITFNPPLEKGFEFTNSFPSNQINMLILGGLRPSSQYTVTVKDTSGNLVSSWKFTTASIAQGASSSSLIMQEEKNYVRTYTPLYQYTPYSAPDFDLKYTGVLKLTVTVKNPDLNKVKQEVNEWIKSHGVDPATHTIIYINT